MSEIHLRENIGEEQSRGISGEESRSDQGQSPREDRPGSLIHSDRIEAFTAANIVDRSNFDNRAEPESG